MSSCLLQIGGTNLAQYAQMKARALEAQKARERDIQLELEVKAEHAKRQRAEEDEVRWSRSK